MNLFVCHVPFHYYMFKNIYKNLEDSQFIICPFVSRTKYFKESITISSIYDYTKRFLEKKKVRFIDYGGENYDDFVKNITNNNFKTVISCHDFKGIGKIEGKRLVRLVYSLGDSNDPTYDFEKNYLSDLIITYGPESVMQFKEHKLEAIPCGNYLLDDWFNDDINREDMEFMGQKLNKQKPTILYLPTWGHSSCIDNYFDSIASLTDEFNIIVKLHHVTSCGEQDRINKFLSKKDFITVGDDFDPLPLYKHADVVLSSPSSGACFDAMALEKPIIMLGPFLGKYDIVIPNDDGTKTIFKKQDIIPHVKEPGELRNMIKETLNSPRKIDEKILHALFYYRDGKAGKRAAEAILDDKSYPAHSTLEKYDMAIKSAPDERIKNDIKREKAHYISRSKPSLMGLLKSFLGMAIKIMSLWKIKC